MLSNARPEGRNAVCRLILSSSRRSWSGGGLNLQATKLLFATSATKGWVVTTPLDLVFGSR